MIVTFFLLIINTFVSFILSFLPVGTLPAGILTGLNYIVGVMNTFNWFFPLDTLFTVLAIAVGFEIIVMVYHFGMWVLRKIPFLNIR